MIGSTPRKAAGAGFARHRAGHSVADRIVSEIGTRIEERHLPTGHYLGTKQELCAEFGVAPATLAKALRVLRTRDIIEVRPGPGGGAFVAEQSPLIRLAHMVHALRDDGATANDVFGVLDALVLTGVNS